MNNHLREQLLTMADRLDHDPEQPADQPLTATERITLANDVSGSDPEFLDLLPRFAEPTTRRVYAVRLRQIAGVR